MIEKELKEEMTRLVNNLEVNIDRDWIFESFRIVQQLNRMFYQKTHMFNGADNTCADCKYRENGIISIFKSNEDRKCYHPDNKCKITNSYTGKITEWHETCRWMRGSRRVCFCFEPKKGI